MSVPDLGRFSDPSILILASLAGGKKHGYAIMEDVEAMARVRLGTGTLYGAIARLEEYGLIEALPSEERGRRPYRLTSAGIAFLREQLTNMEPLRHLACGGWQHYEYPETAALPLSPDLARTL